MGDTPALRPRVTQARRVEIASVAVDVLREVGYEALTMDAVAARARCSKGTLYRLWSDKAQLVATGLREVKPWHGTEIDTGTLRGDLRELCEHIVADIEQDTLLVAGVAHAALVDAKLTAAVRDSLFEPQTARMQQLIERAVVRGELTRIPPVLGLLPGLVLGCLVFRPLVDDGAFTDRELAHRFVDEILLPVIMS
ncbi:TetR/AcrR family transcriptional regulator [Streptomyces sp. NPDC090106]|uniref:TetR/AcrR family transcriptional regulator n=1 Tax=Streptomyces sp. NPDC090106 TaxID=3365946 RepID=UPI003830233D